MLLLNWCLPSGSSLWNPVALEGGRPAKPLQEVMCLVAVCCLGCWEPPSVYQCVFKHFIVFPDWLPADVLWSGREARALGKEIEAAELRQRVGTLMSCALSPVFLLRRSIGFKLCKTWKENSWAPWHRWRKYCVAKKSQQRTGDLITLPYVRRLQIPSVLQSAWSFWTLGEKKKWNFAGWDPVASHLHLHKRCLSIYSRRLGGKLYFKC